MKRNARSLASRVLLVVLAAAYASFANTSVGHTLLASGPLLLDGAERASPTSGDRSAGDPSPPPTRPPIHDESNCAFCQSGSSFSVGPTHVEPCVDLDAARVPDSNLGAAPRDSGASLELARAPPHDLLS